MHFFKLTVAILFAAFCPLLTVHRAHSLPVSTDRISNEHTGSSEAASRLVAEAGQLLHHGAPRLKTPPAKPWVDAEVELPAPADTVVFVAVPLERTKTWHFACRTALHPRAPTVI